jgi:hypothetical protein
MAVSITTNAHDKKTLARAVRLRDAALNIRALMEEWQPGVRVSSAQRGPFRIRYRYPLAGVHAHTMQATRRAPRIDVLPSPGLEIAAKKLLLRIVWDGDAIVLALFERGPWEAEFLRLASRNLGKSIV